jgi:hypothetical protein
LIEVLLLHLEIGNSISEETTNAVVTLENGDGVTHSSQLLSGCQAGRPAAHDCHRLARESLRRDGVDPPLFPRFIDDGNFDLFDGDGWLVDTQDAGRFTRCGTESSSELWEVVGLMKTFNRAPTISPADQIVPFWNEIAQWASLMAEGNTTVHASRGLPSQRARVSGTVDLFPVANSHLYWASLG